MAIPEYTLKQLENVLRPTINWVSDANLPAVFTMREAPGVFFFNIYKWVDFSTGILAEELTPEEGILSKPPSGGKAVRNLFVTPAGKLQVDYEDEA